MSAQMIGGIFGGILGLVNFFLLNNVSESIARKSEGPPPKAAKFIKWAAWADLVIFPLIGYYLGGMFA